MRTQDLGSLSAIHRYPVKSMAGEELPMVYLSRFGMAFDRQYAILDVETGLLANAKNRERWPQIYFYRSRYLDISPGHGRHPAAAITLPDGRTLRSDDFDIDIRLSEAFGRDVSLKTATGRESGAHGSFIDVAPVHIITHASLAQLPGPRPSVDVDPARMRPSLVIEAGSAGGFVEDEWIGRELHIGHAVLRITEKTKRCVRITLPQPSSPEQPELLRHVQEINRGTLGVYAHIVKPGLIRVGDRLTLRE